MNVRVGGAIVAAIVAMTAPMGAAHSSSSSCADPIESMTFGPQSYVDTARAGGEPMIQVHPDGSLLYAAHAGTTHFYAPGSPSANTTAFVQNYQGQTYAWRSTDHGATWKFAPRPAPGNDPFSGFSDPDFAIDKDGNVYLSEINLINVAMSKSTDHGASYALQNFFAETLTDRQWSEADRTNELYIVGNPETSNHVIYKTIDGGKTFIGPAPDDGGLGDLRVDHSDGTVYEAHYASNTLQMAAFRHARAGVMVPTITAIARNVQMSSHWPAFDVDPAGNLYITWDETGKGPRSPGIYYSYSTDRGATWAPALRLSLGQHTVTWPWLTVGSPGRVAIAWLETGPLPSNDTNTDNGEVWRVVAAQSVNGLGCDGGQPEFSRTVATPVPVHTGAICHDGTACEAEAIDRRLGDYFSIDIDGTGALVIAYADTQKGGAVSLPGFVRQSGGPSFITSTFPVVRPATKPAQVLGRRTSQNGSLASTGFDDRTPMLVGAALVIAAAVLRRRSRTVI